jgi:signal transduction histidine kinase
LDVASELAPLVAFKLIVYSLGSLVHLFLMVLILGQRRLRKLEWLLFTLMAALFMWNSGNLLALNVGLFYGVGPNSLSAFARLIPFTGFLIATPLVVCVHAEYLGRVRPASWAQRLVVAAFFLPVAGAPWLIGRLLGHLEMDALMALRPFLRPLAIWLVAALMVAAALNLAARRLPDGRLARFHTALAALQALLALGFFGEYVLPGPLTDGVGGYFAAFLMLVSIAPSGLVGYSIFRYNFLDLQVRRNLIYSLAGIFALLMYLNVIRRLSGYLEVRNLLPSAVTEAFMIFLLVVLLDPIKTQINRLLHAAFVSEFEKVQRLSAEIQEQAKRAGDVHSLRTLVEERVAKELGLERVRLALGRDAAYAQDPTLPRKVRVFPIRRGDDVLASLVVTPVTNDMSGDLYGSLEVLADQLAAALELCQLIADKVQLERALAEQEKMAALGQMAREIAHQVKNPLSPMKALVQLMEEDPAVPAERRRDCRIVVTEIDRLNNKIWQLLRYARPAPHTDRPVDLAGVVSSILTLSRAEAGRRHVHLEWEPSPTPCAVRGGDEAANDIVSNLVGNALEASPEGAAVHVLLARDPSAQDSVTLTVEDEGPGIPPDLQRKIFQPFFTTRPGGTGLGLAIVARRAEEIGGTVELISPVDIKGKRGARFRVRFREAE